MASAGLDGQNGTGPIPHTVLSMRSFAFILLSGLLAQTGCSSREDADRRDNEKVAAAMRLPAGPDASKRLSYNKSYFTKLDGLDGKIDVWTDGSIFHPSTAIDIYIGLRYLSILDNGELTVRVDGPSIKAARSDRTIPLRKADLIESGEYPGILAIRNCFGTDAGLTLLNAIGEHPVKLQIIDRQHKTLASTTLTLPVVDHPGK